MSLQQALELNVTPYSWKFAQPQYKGVRLGYSTWIYSLNGGTAKKVDCQTCQAILAILKKYGPLHQTGLARILGRKFIATSRLPNHLKHLLEAKLVRAELCQPQDFHRYLARTYLALGDLLLKASRRPASEIP